MDSDVRSLRKPVIARKEVFALLLEPFFLSAGIGAEKVEAILEYEQERLFSEASVTSEPLACEFSYCRVCEDYINVWDTYPEYKCPTCGHRI